MNANQCLSISMYSPKHIGSIPNCLFGECIEGPSGAYCQCWNGYQDDRIVGRYRNCGMPIVMPYIGEGFAIFVNLVASIFGLYIVRYGCEKKTDAQRLALLSTTTALSFLFGNAILMARHSIMPWYGAMFINLGMASLCLAYGLVIFTALKPISVFMNIKHTDSIERTLTMIIPSILLAAGVTCTIVGHAIGTDRSVSTAISACYIVIAFCSMCFLPTIKVLNDLLDALDNASESKQARYPAGPLEPVYKSSWAGFYPSSWRSRGSSSNFIRAQDEPASGQESPVVSRQRLRISQRLMTLADKFKNSLVESPAINHEHNHSHANVEPSPSHTNESPIDPEVNKQRLAHLKKKEKLLRFRRKVSAMRTMSSLACAGLTIFSLSAALIDLITGTLPLSGFLFFGLSNIIGIFSIQISHYAWNHRMGGKKRRSREAANQADSNSKKTNGSDQEKTKANSSLHAGPMATTTLHTSIPLALGTSPERQTSIIPSKPSTNNTNESEKITLHHVAVDPLTTSHGTINETVENGIGGVLLVSKAEP